jgi:DNA-binding MarR family transcriptional regulator
MDKTVASVVRVEEIFAYYCSRVLKRMGRFSSGESLLLRLIYLHGTPIHPSDLRERTLISSARVASILGALERKGLITRAIDTEDRRRILVSMTDAGHRQAEAEIQVMRTEFAAVFEEMGPQDTEEFIRLFGRLFEIYVRLYDEQLPGGEVQEASALQTAQTARATQAPAASQASQTVSAPRVPRTPAAARASRASRAPQDRTRAEGEGA